MGLSCYNAIINVEDGIMLGLIEKYLLVFFISMLPIVELRGAIPFGITMGLDVLPTFVVAILGNCLPVPFLILFAKKVLLWLTRFPKIGPLADRIIYKATEKAEKIGNYELLGLFLFVAIPLPGTGAWTGSLVAALLQLRAAKAFPVISLGVVAAGIIMSLASAGLFGALSYIFSF